jgi:type VII secretion protein EccB
MLHDPMRTHSRATIVGAVLGAIGVLAFVIIGFLSPAPSAPNGDGIVIGEQSGQIYVKTGNPPKLIPTFNLASARLLFLAQQQGGQQGQGGAPAAGGGASAEVKAPTVVPDDQLKDIPRGRRQGIPDGPQLLPTMEQRISDHWSVCDKIGLDKTLPNPADINQTETVVFAGVSDLGRELNENEALLVNSDTRQYLIYRLASSPNQPNANAVRAEVDRSSSAVSVALKLPSRARHMSAGLLNAIPEVGKLTPPQIPNAKGRPDYNLAGLTVGDVFSTSRAGAPDYWVALKSGIEQIPAAVADMIRANGTSSSSIRELTPDKLGGIRVVSKGDPGYVSIEDYPQSVPTILDPAQGNAVSCLGWSITGEGTARDGHTAVYVGNDLPGKKDNQGKLLAVDIGQESPDGLKVDKFYMEPGRAAVVRSAVSKDSFDKGPIQLISDSGLRYGIPDVATAAALGLDQQVPAPDSIIRLLPTGASLNTRDVMRTFDSLQVDPAAGSFPSRQPQAAGTGGN